jgi:ABC-type bacteriocin/lantibiotic exporter with double-glycine peptidase domain
MFEQEFKSEGTVDEFYIAQQEISQLVAGALARWIVRWVIGFAAIALVTWIKPQWTWLWWAALALASASLLFTLAMQFVLQRKIAEAQETTRRLEAVLDELDDDDETEECGRAPHIFG